MHDITKQKIMQNWKGGHDVPVVSICCTTYNHEAYIAEAIDGFLIQETDFPFEILIRDDCSTDKTASIVKKYADKYPGLINPIYEKENTFSKGIRAMPAVMQKAVGKYIALCEGDDYWIDSSKLQQQVEFLVDNEDYALCYHSRIRVDENSKIVDTVYSEPNVDYSESELISGNVRPMTNTITFRNILDQSFYESKACLGDALLLHNLGFYGKSKFLNTIINGSAYRIHEGGIWSKRTHLTRVRMVLETKKVIRNSILEKMPNDKLILKKHDSAYPIIINSTLTRFILQKDIKGYLLTLKEIWGYQDLNRMYIFYCHVKYLFSKLSVHSFFRNLK